MSRRDSGDGPGKVRWESELEERFMRLFGGLSDAAYLVETKSGRILSCNPAAALQTGYRCDELIGKNIAKDISGGGTAFEAAEVAEKLAAGGSVRFVHRKRRKDGTPFWDEVIVIPMHADRPVHISLNRDITDRVTEEQALRESEMRYRLIFESTTDAVFIFDREGKIVEANPKANEMLGYGLGELVGLPAAAIIHPDYFHGFANFRRAIDDTGQFIARSINLRKDGTPLDVEVHGGPFILHGSPHLLAVVRDIREQVKAEQRLKGARLKVERLHDAASRLENCMAEDDVYRITVEAAQEILEFGLCSLDMVDGDRLVVKQTSQGLPPDTSCESGLNADNLAAKTHRTRETVVFGSVEEVPEARPTDARFNSGISAPIGSFGVFQVASEAKDAFSIEDVRLLELLLGHTAQAIERIRLQEELVRQANRDPLTGVYNRRYFNQVIEQELARSKRYAHPIGFLMIDINRFKEINDRFGHQMGDLVLQDVATLLKNELRECDLVIRYGGDEFLVVLLETDGETELVKERISVAVRRWNESDERIAFEVTLSIGSAHWDPQSGPPLETTLSDADGRMYAAKRAAMENGSA